MTNLKAKIIENYVLQDKLFSHPDKCTEKITQLNSSMHNIEF